jgi:NAD(P)H-dependent FMN reductase
VPESIREFRDKIERADGVIISTPEYIFSIPSGLKNAIEWCVATTIFTEKPVGIITASAQGQKGHEELQMIMETLTAKLTEETTLLIQGIKGKIGPENTITDAKTEERLGHFVKAFSGIIEGKSS